MALFWLSDEACERSGGPTAGKGDLPRETRRVDGTRLLRLKAKARAITLRTDG